MALFNRRLMQDQRTLAYFRPTGWALPHLISRWIKLALWCGVVGAQLAKFTSTLLAWAKIFRQETV